MAYKKGSKVHFMDASLFVCVRIWRLGFDYLSSERQTHNYIIFKTASVGFIHLVQVFCSRGVAPFGSG